MVLIREGNIATVHVSLNPEEIAASKYKYRF